MMSSVHADYIPAELRALKQWVCWRYDVRGPKGTTTKIPCTVTGALASSIDPKTWCSFDEALAASQRFAGIGFVFSENDPYCGVDLDGCLADDGQWLWGEDFVQWLNTYAEVSPSGHGVKLILRASKPKHARCVKRNADPTHGGAIEIYDRARFFAITGQRIVLAPNEIAARQSELNDLCDHLWPQRIVASPAASPTAVADTDVERRATAYLQAMPPAISGQGGHNATYAAATALVHGFGLSPDRALALLEQQFNPRCEPPWSVRELEHKINDAATKAHDVPFGWLRDANQIQKHADVDLTHLVNLSAPTVAAEPAVSQDSSYADPGPLPLSMLRIPGFVSEVMDHCLETAPYPNQALAFCGALALQAFLAGRKVRDQADNRTNIYLLGLAFSSVGKDWPRKINTEVLHQIGLSGCLGEHFASGEGIQDSLFVTPSMMFQTDEIDGILQTINKSKDARHESVMSTMLTMYSSANSIYPMRRRAGRDSPGAIDQPCLIIYGTAIPTHYYGALSERMLTNGFVARMIVVEAGRRSPGQDPKIITIPERALETAKWWSDFRPGNGNLEHWHPVPAIVEYTPAARQILKDSRLECEAEYSHAEAHGDPVGTTIWGRANEHSRKLALLYAVSVNHRAPSIDADAARWGTRLMMHQTRRALFMAQNHVADNPFHAECLKLVRKLREVPERQLPHSVLLKRMKLDSRTFQEVVTTLEQQGDIATVIAATAGRPQRTYQLLNMRAGEVAG